MTSFCQIQTDMALPGLSDGTNSCLTDTGEHTPQRVPISPLCTMLLSFMYQQQICPSIVIYMEYMQTSPCAQMSAYMLHINSLPSTMWPGPMVYIHFTLLVYAPEQICQSYCMYISLYVYCSQHIQPKLKQLSVKKPATLIYHAITICPNYFMCISGRSIPIHMPYINLPTSTMWWEVLYTGNAHNDADHDIIAKLH